MSLAAAHKLWYFVFSFSFSSDAFWLSLMNVYFCVCWLERFIDFRLSWLVVFRSSISWLIFCLYIFVSIKVSIIIEPAFFPFICQFLLYVFWGSLVMLTYIFIFSWINPSIVIKCHQMLSSITFFSLKSIFLIVYSICSVVAVCIIYIYVFLSTLF